MKSSLLKNHPVLLITLNILLLVVISFLILSRISRNKANNITKPNTKDIVTGIVEKKVNNTLKVKGSFASKTNSVPVLIDIVFDKNTAIIYLNPPTVPYLFRDPVPVLIKPSINDVDIGRSVYIYVSPDSKNSLSFNAEKIEITNPPPITIKGKIVNIVETLLVIDGTPYPPESVTNNPKQQVVKYSIYTTNETEISRIIPISKNSPNIIPEKEKLSFSDLIKEMEVIVYSNIYIGNAQSFTAFRIEPVREQIPLSPSKLVK